MSDHRERSSLSLWFFPSQSRPGGQCPPPFPSGRAVPDRQCRPPIPSGRAVPASISLRSRRRDSPMFRNTRRCSRLLQSHFSHRKCRPPYPSGRAVPASNFLRSHLRHSPSIRSTRRCSRLLLGHFTPNYAFNKSADLQIPGNV